MKLSELIQKLTVYTQDGIDYDVRIVTNDRVCPAIPSVGIQSIFQGFDWDHGKLLIYPDKDVVTVKDKKKVQK